MICDVEHALRSMCVLKICCRFLSGKLVKGRNGMAIYSISVVGEFFHNEYIRLQNERKRVK